MGNLELTSEADGTTHQMIVGHVNSLTLERLKTDHRAAQLTGGQTPDILSLLRHRDATRHTSEKNFFYRLSHRKPEVSRMEKKVCSPARKRE